MRLSAPCLNSRNTSEVFLAPGDVVQIGTVREAAVLVSHLSPPTNEADHVHGCIKSRCPTSSSTHVF